jgi:hypothetical protein
LAVFLFISLSFDFLKWNARKKAFSALVNYSLGKVF